MGNHSHRRRDLFVVFLTRRVIVWSVALFGLCSCGGDVYGSSSSPTEELVGALMEWNERETLYSAIRGFVGSSWNGSDLYPEPCGWTPIQGVSCDLHDEKWYVSVMNIGSFYDNSLRCAPDANFTHHLFDLKHLSSLSFNNCFFSPQANPVAISGLSWERLAGSLTALEFRSNPGLIGTLPPSFGSLGQLQSLVLLENGLGGNIPFEIGNLGNLKRLVMSESGFEGNIPDSLGRLSNLLILDMSGNKLSGSIPTSLQGLTSLLKLDLSGNSLGGPVPGELANLKSLVLLDLGKNNLTGGLARWIQDMVSLEELVMSHNPNLGGDLKAINWGNVKNLRSLDLTNIGLKGNIPDSMSNLRMLRHLGLGNNSLTGTPPRGLSLLPHIGALYLNGNSLTGQLEFPPEFYAKMRWRFSGEDNPGLCYRFPITTSADAAPHGINPCITAT
ncbi:hypothetical protein MLD38_038308 [Melastoma candidum]|uniref:Uncharacterized protein n=1 Tax=Melastoma candidum TaxID=119954 RepID=A0ACB9KYT0_9MYRT|nr:hypothetical protein MLD38_038308 [Melastoma candidum]